MTARFAVYWAPPADSALWRTASRWLGRDAATGESFALDSADAFAGHDPCAFTANARHYGFHATLKPPFALAEGTTPEMLRASVARLASTYKPFDAPPLKLSRIDGFLALMLSAPSPAMDALAAACVRELDTLRAAPGEAELRRRRANGLTPRQDALLERWGYPYVFDEFRFHLTLTDRLTAEQEAVVAPRLQTLMLEHERVGPRIDSLALFHHEKRDAPFMVAEVFPFAG